MLQGAAKPPDALSASSWLTSGSKQLAWRMANQLRVWSGGNAGGTRQTRRALGRGHLPCC